MNSYTVEFVIEPFVENAPGPHVMSGIKAVEDRGLQVTMGPFASIVTGDVEDLSGAIGAMVEAAMEHGAERVLIEVVADNE